MYLLLVDIGFTALTVLRIPRPRPATSYNMQVKLRLLKSESDLSTVCDCAICMQRPGKRYMVRYERRSGRPRWISCWQGRSSHNSATGYSIRCTCTRSVDYSQGTQAESAD